MMVQEIVTPTDGAEARTTALAVPQPRPVRASPYEPATWEQAVAAATMIASSGFLGRTPARPESVFFLMARGHELGFSMAQSVDAFDIIDGKATLRAQAMVALCKSRTEVCEWLRPVETTDDHATWETQRRGHPNPDRMTFTYTQAQRAGYTSKQNWKTQPDTMLLWRAAVKLCRLIYPDILLGLYSTEEIEDADYAARQATKPGRPSMRVVDADPSEPAEPEAEPEPATTAANVTAPAQETAEPEPDEGDDAEPEPVAGERAYKEGDACHYCAEQGVSSVFAIAKGGENRGRLQCKGRIEGQWANHLAPEPAGFHDPAEIPYS